DGELHVEIKQTVRGGDVFILQPTSIPADEHIMELLFLADACRRAGAARLTAVMPYFGYARQDRRADGREAIGAAVVAALVEAAGFSRVVTVDLHSPAIEGFFRIPVEHLSATRLLVEGVHPAADAVIVAPDLGAAKLAERYARHLNVSVVTMHKKRISGSEVELRSIVGNVKDRAPIIVDDMITTGATIEAAANGLLAAGCQRAISVIATHGVFAAPAPQRLEALPIQQLIVTDSVQPAVQPSRLQVVSVAPLIADAIGRLHRGDTLAPLLARA
ncbi:MAG TPA: ribose-phosphate pyrophosphokinase, partial [Vicinamibacterales bacterium]|nr:ribose-phosphate pyrophosphokinase [Vicinamibacterales bacterium]